MILDALVNGGSNHFNLSSICDLISCKQGVKQFHWFHCCKCIFKSKKICDRSSWTKVLNCILLHLQTIFHVFTSCAFHSVVRKHSNVLLRNHLLNSGNIAWGWWSLRINSRSFMHISADQVLEVHGSVDYLKKLYLLLFKHVYYGNCVWPRWGGTHSYFIYWPFIFESVVSDWQ